MCVRCFTISCLRVFGYYAFLKSFNRRWWGDFIRKLSCFYYRDHIVRVKPFYSTYHRGRSFHKQRKLQKSFWRGLALVFQRECRWSDRFFRKAPLPCWWSDLPTRFTRDFLKWPILGICLCKNVFKSKKNLYFYSMIFGIHLVVIIGSKEVSDSILLPCKCAWWQLCCIFCRKLIRKLIRTAIISVVEHLLCYGLYISYNHCFC